MNNLLSCCGLVDVRINASDKDLPVHRLKIDWQKAHLDHPWTSGSWLISLSGYTLLRLVRWLLSESYLITIDLPT